MMKPGVLFMALVTQLGVYSVFSKAPRDIQERGEGKSPLRILTSAVRASQPFFIQLLRLYTVGVTQQCTRQRFWECYYQGCIIPECSKIDLVMLGHLFSKQLQKSFVQKRKGNLPQSHYLGSKKIKILNSGRCSDRNCFFPLKGVEISLFFVESTTTSCVDSDSYNQQCLACVCVCVMFGDLPPNMALFYLFSWLFLMKNIFVFCPLEESFLPRSKYRKLTCFSSCLRPTPPPPQTAWGSL